MDFLDGHTRSRDMTNGLGERGKSDYFRLDTKLPSPIRLDDVKTLQAQKERIYLNPQGQLTEVATALLVSNYFFTLDSRPHYQGGFYYCQGSIRCRINPKGVFEALGQLCASTEAYFTAESEILGDHTSIDICSTCCRYRKAVSFFVRHPTDTITLYLRANNGFRRKISGFPNSIKWFEDKQGLSSPFGTTKNDLITLPCPACDKSKKRKTSESSAVNCSKRKKTLSSF